MSQNGVSHFGIPRQHIRLHHVSVLTTGCLWGLREWTFFKHQHSPSVPQITMLSDVRVVVSSQKDNNLLPITLVHSHSSIANSDILQSIHPGYSWWVHQCSKQRGQRSLAAIMWTSLVRSCVRTEVPMCFKLALPSPDTLSSSGRWSLVRHHDTLRSILAYRCHSI